MDAEDILMERESFYLETGKALLNLGSCVNSLGGLERLFNFEGNPSKEEILHYVNLARQNLKNAKELMDELRDKASVHNQIKIKKNEIINGNKWS